MSDSVVEDYYALAALFSPSQISRFLTARKWRRVGLREDICEYWSPPDWEDEREPRYVLALPLNREFADFDRRMVELLRGVAEREEVAACQLEELILSLDFDSIIVRVVQKGTSFIGITDASRVLSTFHRVIELSARYTLDPTTSFKGRRPAAVASYVDAQLKLGHTRRGSYAFPIFSAVDSTEGVPREFGRHVLANLLLAMQQLRDQVGASDTQSPDDGIDRLGYEIASTMESLARTSQIRSLHVALNWSTTQQPPRGVPDEVDIEDVQQLGRRRLEIDNDRQDLSQRRRLYSASESIATRRIAGEVAEEGAVSLAGFVVAIEMDDRRRAVGGGEYFVTIRPQGQRSFSDVRLRVDRAEYRRAVRAHLTDELLTITGIASKKSRELLEKAGLIPKEAESEDIDSDRM